ncbi:hypothetical protein LTR49_028087 [Elasticomyces elasticus]|nr:hypothetical protein LTR49_028087 [Elasticomyces elasticus]
MTAIMSQESRQLAILRWTDLLGVKLRQAGGPQRKQILEGEAREIARDTDFAALRAEILWTENAGRCEASSVWVQVKYLAEGAQRISRTDHLEDPKHFRALLFVTKTWGLEKVDRYQWRHVGRNMIEELRKFAESCPDWDLAVRTLNAAMMSRHIEEVHSQGYRGRRIGGFHGNDNVKDEGCPITRPDIIMALGWADHDLAERCSGPQRKRRRLHHSAAPPNIPDNLISEVSSWTRLDGEFQSPPQADASSLALAAERRGRLLGFDLYGLLVPRHLECPSSKAAREAHRASLEETQRYMDDPIITTQPSPDDVLKAITLFRSFDTRQQHYTLPSTLSHSVDTVPVDTIGMRASSSVLTPARLAVQALASPTVLMHTPSSLSPASSSEFASASCSETEQSIMDDTVIPLIQDVPGQVYSAKDQARDSMNTGKAVASGTGSGGETALVHSQLINNVDDCAVDNEGHRATKSTGSCGNVSPAVGSSMQANATIIDTEALRSGASADCLICHGPCSAGHVPLCFEDQDMRQKFFQNLHKADKLTHDSRKTKGWSRDVLRSWTRDLRIGSIYYEPTHIGKSSCSKEDAEVWCLDDATFKRYADEGVIFLVPVIVKEHFKDSKDHSKARYAQELSDALGPRSLKVRTYTTSGNVISMHSKQLVQRLLRPLASQLPINALDLAPWAKAEKPYFTSLTRFRLLDRLVDRRRFVGKQTDRMPFDVAGCLLFDLLGFPGAFSGARLDSLVGTWLRTLFGSKFWMVVPPESMTPQDWTNFARESHRWDPDGKARAIYLEPNDVLLMPPGVPLVHAVLTLETCLQEGGMLWDERVILSTLKNLFWIGQHQQATNEAWPHQLLDIINELQTLVSSDLQRFAGELSPDDADVDHVAEIARA